MIHFAANFVYPDVCGTAESGRLVENSKIQNHKGMDCVQCRQRDAVHNKRSFTSTAGGLCWAVYMRGRV